MYSDDELKKKADQIRLEVIKNSAETGVPHLGSCLSCLDILTVIYLRHLNIDPNDPLNDCRDRFVLSKGHAAPALYFTLAEAGFFPKELLKSYGKDGAIFHEHPPSPSELSGIEAATGSLGHGMPMAVGFAMASKIKKLGNHVLALISDGECNEGSIWEAAMLASANNLSNLTILVDYNKWQATGKTSDIILSGRMKEKWSAFGWKAREVDGHDISEISFEITQAYQKKQPEPTVIICHTLKGKGVSFMEDDNNWHYRIPNNEEVELAKIELELSS